jgi:hypothetical protein
MCIDEPRQNSNIWKLDATVGINRRGQRWTNVFDSARRSHKPMITKRFRDHADQPCRLNGNSIHAELVRVPLLTRPTEDKLTQPTEAKVG